MPEKAQSISAMPTEIDRRAAGDKPRQKADLRQRIRQLGWLGVYLILAAGAVNVTLLPAYLNTLEYLKIKAQADNAKGTERAKADELLGKAKQNLAAAENAAITAKAEMDKNEADAEAADAQAKTKQQEAMNAPLKAQQEAQATAGQAEILHQQALQMQQTALNAAQTLKAQADAAVAEAATGMTALDRMLIGQPEFDHCPGRNSFQKIDAFQNQHC